MEDYERYNNQGQAKAHPKNASALAYSIICDACKRYFEGEIREHKSYDFYSGFQIKIFITHEQWQLLHKLLLQDGRGAREDLIVNGKLLGEWDIWYHQGRRNCQLILTLDPAFYEKHSIVKRFAQLAVVPLDPAIEIHTCACGFPMVKPDSDGNWECKACWRKRNPDDLVF